MTSASSSTSSARGPPAGPSRRWRSAAPPPCRSACAERRGAGPRRVPDCLPRNAAWCDRPSSRRLPREPRPRRHQPSSKENLLTLRTACLPLFKSADHARLGSIRHASVCSSGLPPYPENRNPVPCHALPRPCFTEKQGQCSPSLHQALAGDENRCNASQITNQLQRLPGHPPNGPDTRAPRPHRTTTRTSPIHPNPHRPRDAARHQINSRQTVITAVWSH